MSLLLSVQYTVLILLVIISLQAGRALKTRALLFIALGWLAMLINNALYSVWPVSAYDHYPGPTSILLFFSFLAAALFWYAAYRYGHEQHFIYFSTLRKSLFLAILVASCLLSIAARILSDHFGFLASSLVESLVSTASLIALAFYFREIGLQQRSSPARWPLLYVATLIYAGIQPVGFLQDFLYSTPRQPRLGEIDIGVVGFVGAIVAKILILFGTINILVASAEFSRATADDSVLPSEFELRRIVRRIIDSDEFATAIRPILPKGEDDKQFGFDYIPFLLRNIDKRRLRFRASSQIFLVSTLIMAAIFSLILAGLGFILVNDAAVGDPHRLAEIRTSIDKIEQEIPVITERLEDNPIFMKTCEPALLKIDEFPNQLEGIAEQKKTIKGLMDKRDVSKLQSSLDEWIQQDAKAVNFIPLLEELKQGLAEFMSAREHAVYLLPGVIADLNKNIASASTEINSAQARLPELLKRITIGLVVATFFLAILRYVAGLYREHYKQMVFAEQDDLAIRRFYIAFRSSTGDKEQRSQVLAKFMTGANANGFMKEQESEKDLSSQSHELVKEILSVLAKKAGS